GGRWENGGKGESNDWRGGSWQTTRSKHDEGRQQPQQHEDGGCRRDEDRGNAPVISERNSEDGEGACEKNGCGDIETARAAPVACNLIAEERRDRHGMGASERPHGESGGGG